MALKVTTPQMSCGDWPLTLWGPGGCRVQCVYAWRPCCLPASYLSPLPHSTSRNWGVGRWLGIWPYVCLALLGDWEVDAAKIGLLEK